MNIEPKSYGLLIGGAEVSATGGSTLASISPIDGTAYATIADAGADDVSAAVEAARHAYATAWRRLSATDRGRLLIAFAEVIGAEGNRLAEIESRDNGKLLKETRAQLGAVPGWYRYFGGLADKIEGRTIPVHRIEAFAFTRREPYGVVGIVTPWNSPILLATLAIAPALAAGNTVVVKPSELASVSVLELAQLAQCAGIPDGVINVVTGGPAVGTALVDHPGVAKVAFTGGENVGRRVASAVGGRLAPITLELGGKSANIVFDDADLSAATAGVLAGIFGASGQTCVAGSRAFVHNRIYDAFVETLAERTAAIRLGDPLAETTDVGPVISRRHRDMLVSRVAAAREHGGRIVTGGAAVEPLAAPHGFYFQPTIIDGVGNDDPIAREELFGPVLSVIRFEDEEMVAELANETRYGLAAGVWSRDIRRCLRMVERLQAGTVWVNMYRSMTFNVPFGGYKHSGFGRLNGAEAVDAFLQTKAVWIDVGGKVQDPFTLKS